MAKAFLFFSVEEQNSKIANLMTVRVVQYHWLKNQKHLSTNVTLRILVFHLFMALRVVVLLSQILTFQNAMAME